MFKIPQERLEKIQSWLNQVFFLQQNIKYTTVDFNRSWWRIFIPFRGQIAIILGVETISRVFRSLLPFLLGYAIAERSFTILWMIIGGLVFAELIIQIRDYVYKVTASSLHYSLQAAANEFFLTVDPEFHTTKSTGQIRSKISAGGRQFMMMLYDISFSLLGVLVSFVTVSVALFQFDWLLGLLTIGMFAVISCVSILGNIFASQNFVPFWIKKRDAWNTIETENLTQVFLIRSTFSTPEQLEKTHEVIHEGVSARSVMHLVYDVINNGVQLLYIGSIAVVAGFMLNLFQQGQVQEAIAISLVLTYVSASSQILQIGRFTMSVSESIEDLNDLWRFIQNFGKQTYPVLESDNEQQS